MAQGVGSVKSIQGYLDTFGGKFYEPADYSGSASYVQGGDLLNPPAFGCNNTILTLIGGIDQSGKWLVVGKAVQNGIGPMQAVWISLTSTTVGGQAQTAGQEAVAGTNLSSFTVRLSAIGI